MATVTDKDNSIPTILTKVQQAGVIEFMRQCSAQYNVTYGLRTSFEEMDRLYLRENDYTEEERKAKLANRLGDATKFRNIQLPMCKEGIETAVGYQASVFCSGFPVFKPISPPKYSEQASQMEAILANQELHGSWTNHIVAAIRNGFKYNVGAIEVSWDRELTSVPTSTELSPKLDDVLWQGNALRALDMYNVFWDTRVPAKDVYKDGEYAGYTEYMSRVKLKSFISKLPKTMNAKDAFESGGGGDITGAGVNIGVAPLTYYVPMLNPDSTNTSNLKGTTNWLAWLGASEVNLKQDDIEYRNGYNVTTLYGRIIPCDFGLTVPKPKTPQVWKFIVVNSAVVIFAEKLANAHNWIPILFAQPADTGLNYQDKSLIADLAPYQHITSALSNAIVHAERRRVQDRFFYNPAMYARHHMESPNPIARIPMKPGTRDAKPSDGIYTPQYNDASIGKNVQEIDFFTKMSQKLTGQNQAKQGQFVKGNKTLHEYENVMANANTRDQIVAMSLECTFFAPMKQILMSNILQFQGSVTLVSPSDNKVVSIDPVALRKATIIFRMADGLMPASKLANTDTIKAGMQAISSSPQIAAGYNLAPLFSYLMDLEGGTEMSQFEKSKAQMAYEQAANQWNMIAQQYAAKGIEFKTPQPKPQDYGYDPNAKESSSDITGEGKTVLQGIVHEDEEANASTTSASLFGKTNVEEE